MKQKHVLTQAGNPHNLTVNQHVMPRRSIERFARNGEVEVFTLQYGKKAKRHPKNELFCVKRLWDQREETIGSHSTEEAYLRVADHVLSGGRELSLAQQEAVTEMFFLWRARCRAKQQPAKDEVLKGVEGTKLTQDEQEILESKGVIYLDEEGRVPSRFLNGVLMRITKDRDHFDLGPINWGILEATEGEFLVPDNCGSALLMPLSPKICFGGNMRSQRLSLDELAKTNSFLRSLAVSYYFGRDLNACLIKKMTIPLERLIIK